MTAKVIERVARNLGEYLSDTKDPYENLGLFSRGWAGTNTSGLSAAELESAAWDWIHQEVRCYRDLLPSSRQSRDRSA